MNPLFRIDFSISDSLKIVRKSVLIYETIIAIPFKGNAAHEFSDFRPVLHMIDNIRHTAKPSHLLLAAL